MNPRTIEIRPLDTGGLRRYGNQKRTCRPVGGRGRIVTGHLVYGPGRRSAGRWPGHGGAIDRLAGFANTDTVPFPDTDAVRARRLDHDYYHHENHGATSRRVPNGTGVPDSGRRASRDRWWLAGAPS